MPMSLCWTCGQDVSFPSHKPQEEQLVEVTQLRQQLEDVNKDCAEKRSQLDAVATELEAAKLTISELRRDVSDNRVSSLFLHLSYVTWGGPAASQCSSLPHSMCLTTLLPSPPLLPFRTTALCQEWLMVGVQQGFVVSCVIWCGPAASQCSSLPHSLYLIPPSHPPFEMKALCESG